MRALYTKRESFTPLLDEAKCYRQLRQLRWLDGKVRCPYCGSEYIAKSWTYFLPVIAINGARAGGGSTTRRVRSLRDRMPLLAWFHGFYLSQLSQSTNTIAKELPCDYHTAQRIVWLVREEVICLEAECILKGTVEADEIYVTAGHKGQARGGGVKPLPFPPSAAGQEVRERARQCG